MYFYLHSTVKKRKKCLFLSTCEHSIALLGGREFMIIIIIAAVVVSFEQFEVLKHTHPKNKILCDLFFSEKILRLLIQFLIRSSLSNKLKFLSDKFLFADSLYFFSLRAAILAKSLMQKPVTTCVPHFIFCNSHQN